MSAMAQDDIHAVRERHEVGFIRRYIFSTDHKVIGIQYYLTAVFMAIVGGLMAMLIRLQLAYPKAEWHLLGKLFPSGMAGGVMKPDFYNALVTMHAMIMVFWFLTVILSGGFGNILIPLQIGARDMAFPFLNMLSYWVFFLSIPFLVACALVEGGMPGTGWTLYPPLSAIQESAPGSGLGLTLFLIGAALLIVALLMGSLNYITTIFNLRCPGMTMMRLPITIWALLITAILALLSFPVLTAAVIMLLFDRHAGTAFFLPPHMVFTGKHIVRGSGHPLLWQHMFWFLGHPEVYILLLPAMGFVGDILANGTRKPIFGYRLVVGALIAAGILSFLVWAHHMFTSGMNPYAAMVFSLLTILISVPFATVTLCYIATLWRAKIRFTTAMLFAVGFLSLFVTGGLGGLFLGTASTDIYFHDTYFVVAHFHLVMASAVLFGAFAGTYFWFPKMLGRMMNETLGKVHFWLTIIPTYLLFFPMHFLGMGGMMRRIYTTTEYDFLAPLQPLNVFISHAAFVLGAAQLLFLVNFFWSMFKGKKAERNPWQATTLEWQAPSPPPHGNWGETVPIVHRWAYDYSLPDAAQDYIPQTIADALAHRQASDDRQGGESDDMGRGETAVH